MMHSRTEYLAAGANRHPSTADWDISGLLAYGADRNVALWWPQVRPLFIPGCE
jgi:elongator complex protein 2